MSQNAQTNPKKGMHTGSVDIIENMANDTVSKNRFVNIIKVDSDQVDINVDDKIEPLKYQLFDDIKDYDNIEALAIKGIIVALGSNSHATLSLQMARDELECYLDQGVWSSELVNPDYTATKNQPKPDYTNQCGYLTLSSENNPYVIQNVVDYCKSIEAKIEYKTRQSINGAGHSGISHLGIGHLDSELEKNGNSLSTKQRPFREVLIDIDVLAVDTDDGLIALKKRYPFKQHEWVGIIELFENNAFKDV